MTQTQAPSRLDPRAPAPPEDHETRQKIVEALIFVSDEPITIDQIGQVLTGRTIDELRAIIEKIGADLEKDERGLRIEEVAGGYRFSTRPELAPWIRCHFRNRNRARLSPASVETLAVVAYKQPITGPEIQEIRGVDPQGAIKTLLDKRLIRIAGKKKVVGRPFLYTTTRHFLMHFGLASIDDLPPIEDFERLAEGLEAGSDLSQTDRALTGGSPTNGGEADPYAGDSVPMDDDEGPEGEAAGDHEMSGFSRGSGAARGMTPAGTDEEE